MSRIHASGYYRVDYAQDLRLIQTRTQRGWLFAALAALATFPWLADAFLLDLANQVFLASIGALALMLLTGFAGQISLGHAGLLAAGAFTTGILFKELGASFWVTLPASAAVGALLRAIDGYAGHELTAVALRLTPHLFVRPGELRQAEWAEIDSHDAVWSIPAEKMKMRRSLCVPLSRQVLAMLEELHALTGHGRYLFPSFRTPRRCMSENTVSAALRRLGYSREEMTAHGFRATAATLLNQMGMWHPDAIERQLAHLDANATRRVYTRGEYWDERVRMMQHWSDYLDELRDGAQILRPAFGKSATSTA